VVLHGNNGAAKFMLSAVAEMTINIDHENLSDGLISTLKFGWVVYQCNGEGPEHLAWYLLVL
jgi:hypothetical protein